MNKHQGTTRANALDRLVTVIESKDFQRYLDTYRRTVMPPTTRTIPVRHNPALSPVKRTVPVTPLRQVPPTVTRTPKK